MYSARDLLAALTDSRSAAFAAASSGASAALTLVDPRTLSASGRLGYRVLNAALGAGAVWAATGADDDLVPRPLRAGLTVGAAGVVLGAAEVGEALDARIHDALRGAGVTRPRAAMAFGVGAVSLASWWADRRTAQGDQEGDVEREDDDEDLLVALPHAVRALAEGLLAHTDDFGAPALRAQLAAARAEPYEGPVPDGFWPGIGFHVPTDLPLAVPGDANFPVIGRYRALSGRTFDVYLTLTDGRLTTLSVGEGRDWSPDDHIAWMAAGRGVFELPGWPSPAELTYLVETPEGLRPV